LGSVKAPLKLQGFGLELIVHISYNRILNLTRSGNSNNCFIFAEVLFFCNMKLPEVRIQMYTYLTRPKHTCVNKLQVHLSCMLGFDVSLFHLHVLIIVSISDCRVIAFQLVMLRGTTGRICLHLIFMASLFYGREKRQDRYKRKQFIHAL